MPSTDLVYRFLGLDAGAGAQFDRMAGKTAMLGKSSDTALRSLKRLALGVGAVSAVVGVEAVKSAANFQTELTRIHTQANASIPMVDKLRQGILNMTVAVATAPSDLAKAAYHIASVGQHSLTAAQQLRVLKVAAEEAKLSGANLEDVTNALAVAVISGIKGVKSYGQAMGVLNATVGAGNMTMQNLAESLGTGVLASAKNAGLSIRDVSGALAVLGDNARTGSIAGNTLSRTFNLMLNPSGSAAKALASVGLSATSLATDMHKPDGLVVALTDLKKHLQDSGLTAVQQAQVISTAFGRSRGSTYVELLLQQLQRLKNKEAEVAQGGKSFFSSWAGYTKTFQYAWDSARTAVQKMVIELGSKLLPIATKVFNWISHHTRALVVAAGAWAAFKIGARLAAIAMAQFDVAADANPIGAITLALEAVTAAFIYFYTKSRTFRDVVKETFIILATVVGKWAQANLIALKYVADAMLSFVGTIIHAAASAFGWIPGLGGQLKGAASAFDGFRASVDSTLSGLADDAGKLGSYAGSLFANNFISRAEMFQNAARYYVRGKNLSGLKGLAQALGQGPPSTGGIGSGGSGVPVPTTGGGSAGMAASALHITARNLVKALASGLMNGWQGFSQTVEDSLSTGTRNLLNQLQKQFKTVTDGMAKLVKDARTKLANDLKAQTQFVQQMMSDAALSNAPTVDSGYTGQTTRLTNLSTFLGGQAANYALFAKDLKRLSHMGLNKGLFNQIAAMGPTQGLQFAQQILSNPAMISQLNSYQKQISASAKAIGQDRYGSQIQADRRNLHRQTELQERMARRLDHLAKDIGQEVAAAVLTAGKVNGKAVGLTQHEAQQILNALNKLKRRQGK